MHSGTVGCPGPLGRGHPADFPVIELTTAHPTEQQRIRAALATVAPFVGLTPSDSPLPILAALEDVLERSWP